MPRFNFPLLRALSNQAPTKLTPEQEAEVLKEWSRLLVDSFQHFTLPGLSNTMFQSSRPRTTWKYISYWNPRLVSDPMAEFTLHIQGIYRVDLYRKALYPAGRFLRHGWALSRDGNWWYLQADCVLRTTERDEFAEAPTTIRVVESTPGELMLNTGLSLRSFHSVLLDHARTWAERAQVRFDESTTLLANLEAIRLVLDK